MWPHGAAVSGNSQIRNMPPGALRYCVSWCGRSAAKLPYRLSDTRRPGARAILPNDEDGHPNPMLGADAPLDCVVVGGGPAGLTAAIFLARFGRRFVLVDSDNSR